MDYENRLHNLLVKVRKKLQTPGIAVGLSVNGDHYFSSAGYSNLERKEKYFINTPFKIGKISEIFISVLFFQLVEKGILEINDSIEKHLDFIEFIEPKWNMRFVSFKDLLTHTSGLGDLRNDGDVFIKDNGLYPKNSFDQIQLHKYYSVPLKQFFAPQTQWYHSPHNYGLLATCIEDKTDLSLETLFQTEICTKLDIINTHFCNSSNKNETIGYKTANGKAIIDDQTKKNSFLFSSSSSTIYDLLTIFDELLRCYVGDSSKIINEISAYNLFQKLYHPHFALDPVSAPFNIIYQKPLILEYNSENLGIITKAILLPEYRTSLIITSNSINKQEFGHYARNIFDTILSDLSIEHSPLEFTAKNLVDQDSLESFIGVFRPQKPSPLNLSYLSDFGNDVFLLVKKNNRLIMKNILPNVQWNSQFKGGKKLKFADIDNGAIIYGYKANGKINRLVIPKTKNPGYIYLQTEGPLILFRSKYNFSTTRYFGLIFYVYISKVRHQIFIPIFRLIGNLILAIPKYSWFFLLLLLVKSRKFITSTIPKHYAKFKPILKSGLRSTKQNSLKLFSKIKINSRKLWISSSKSINKLFAKIKISLKSLKINISPKLKNFKLNLIKFFRRVKIILNDIGKTIKHHLNNFGNKIKANSQKFIRKSKPYLRKLSRKIENGFSRSKQFISYGLSIFNKQGMVKLSSMYIKSKSLFPKNLTIIEKYYISYNKNIKIRKLNIQAYNLKYPRRLKLNKQGLIYLNLLMKSKRTNVLYKFNVKFPILFESIKKVSKKLVSLNIIKSAN